MSAESQWGASPEQSQWRANPEASGPSSVDKVRAAAVEAARRGSDLGKEALLSGIESGTLEKWGHKGIDVTTKTVKAGILASGPGGIVGRMVAGRALGAVESAAHDRLGGALNRVGSQIEASRNQPPAQYELQPAPVPSYEAPAATWSTAPTVEYGAPQPTYPQAPSAPRWAEQSAAEVAPIAPPSADNPWVKYLETPAVIPEEKKRGLFKRNKPAGEPTANTPVVETPYTWGQTPPSPWGS